MKKEKIRFVFLPIGTIFMCTRGKFKKVRNGSSMYEPNCVSVPFGTPININGNMYCEVLEEGKGE